ncbi:MAG: TonB-system energizer ExbB [Syntrophaceae bacterium]
MVWLQHVVDFGIIGLLILLSIVVMAIFIERHLFLRRIDIERYKESRRVLEIEITRKLGVIASIGSNAPYIGLLGTVLGIMITFHTIGTQGYLDASRTMVGLALALKSTAFGLLVAIPSIVFYNTLLRRVKVILLEWDDRHG